MTWRSFFVPALVAATLCLAPSAAHAETPAAITPASGAPAGNVTPASGSLTGNDTPSSYAVFALIVGVNRSVDPDAPVLRYADDDAARYLDLFRSMGARAYVMTRPDDNTRRLYPQLAAEALQPIRRDFDRAVAALARDVVQARERSVRTLLYFVYAGHGRVHDGRGYVTLEDDRLDAATLDSALIDAVSADATHIIVDACDSYFLALARGPGGQREEAHGFAGVGGLRTRDSVGLLLSTSSARESHEWSGIQAGVFSHEVRSALYGAADADGDGLVSYREVSAFIERANEAIPNEEYRPRVFARAPKDTSVLLDLRGRLHSRIEIPGTHADHYLLEDSRGVRLADSHNRPDGATYLLRPPHAGKLYLRRLGADLEYVVPNSEDLVTLAQLTPADTRSQPRGAAADSFELLFSLPFGSHDVDSYSPTSQAAREPDRAASPPIAWRRWAGVTVLAGSAVAGVIGGLTLGSAHDESRSVTAGASQLAARSANADIHAKDLWGGVEIGAAGVAATTGLLLLLWPEARTTVDVAGSASGAGVSVHGTF
jgi:hypothetical protein